MAISAINFDSSSGLKSVQDLYDMINGKTTETSGGTTTKTENSGISQDSMNAMLKSALEGTNGLAAVSGGQRAAGGYGSATNQLLTNDLLTRSAAAVAASAQNKTTTTTSTPQKTVVGGASAGGVAKTAGFLQAIKLLSGITGDKTKGKGASEESDFNALVNEGGTMQAGFNGPDSGAYATHQGVGSSVDDLIAFNESADSGGQVLQDAGDSSQTSATDSFDYNQVAGDNGGDSGGSESFDYNSVSGDNTVDSTPLWIPQDDSGDFAVGGMVRAKNHTKNYADGGEVKATIGNNPASKGKILGTSQFNTVIDPAVAARGSQGVGFNTSNPVGQTVAPSGTGITESSSGTSSENNPVADNSNSGNSSGINLSDLSSVGKALGIAGSLSGTKELGQLGTILGIAGSSNPALSAVRAGLNIATHGASGAIEKISKEKSAASVADVVMGVSNPVLATINGILGLAGKASLGNIGANAFSAMDKDSWIGLQDIADRNPNSAGMARAANKMDGDPLDNLTGLIQTGVTPRQAAFKGAVAENNTTATPNTDALQALLDSNNAFGTGGSSMSESNQNATNNANAAPGDALDNLMSETGAFGTADTGSQDSGQSGSVSDSSVSGGPGDGSTFAATGGEMHGPGTGTSDSIEANVSDGETIITAQTTAKVKQMFGNDFFHNLEVQFNKPAAVKQKQMGRA